MGPAEEKTSKMRRFEMTSREIKGKLLKVVAIGMLGIVLSLGIPAFAQKATINVMGVQDPWYFALEEIIPQFEKETGIKVNFEGLSWDALQARLTTSFITKEKGVDVISVDDCRLAQFAENTWIVPLTPLIKKDKQAVKMNEFVPQIIYSSCAWRGDIYTLPVATYSQFVMYRTDLLERAGLLNPPTNPADWWTWNEYMKYVKKLDGLSDKIYGTVIVGSQPVPIVHMYTGLEVSRGVRWFKKFPEAPWDFTPTINTQKSIDTLKFYQELYKYSPPEAINYLWFDAGTAFAKKDVGIYYWWSPYGYLARHAGYMVEEASPIVGKFGVSLMPYQPGEAKTYSLGAHGFGIPQYSAAKDEAWEFIKWATSSKEQKAMALTHLHAFNDFSRKPLFEDPELIKYYPWLPTQLRTLELSDGKISRPHMPLYPSLEGFYGLQLNSALAGHKTPEQAMADAQAQWEVIMKQNFYLPYVGLSYDDTLDKTIDLIKELSP